jgi:hypothetical protein
MQASVVDIDQNYTPTHQSQSSGLDFPLMLHWDTPRIFRSLFELQSDGRPQDQAGSIF